MYSSYMYYIDIILYTYNMYVCMYKYSLTTIQVLFYTIYSDFLCYKLLEVFITVTTKVNVGQFVTCAQGIYLICMPKA